MNKLKEMFNGPVDEGRRNFLRTTSIALMALTATACMPEVNATQPLDPSKTPTPETLPSSTPTNQPTPTETATPTENPQQITDELGLKKTPLYETRTFTKNGDYLYDNYNNVPKAVRNEDGTWRKLDYSNPEDAETMYGGLVLSDGEYIHPDIRSTSRGPVGRVVEPIFLGDWEVDEVEYDGQVVHIYNLLTGLRDGDGRLHIVRLAWDAPDFGPAHNTRFECYIPRNAGTDPVLSPGGGITVFDFKFNDSLSLLRVGERVGLWVNEPSHLVDAALKDDPSGIAEYINAQVALMRTLYNDRPGEYDLSAAEKRALERYEWPDRIVTLALTDDGPVVYRDEFLECYGM